MSGWKGKNRDGNHYLPELRDELIRIINSSPDYFIGIQPGVLVDVGRGYDPVMREFVMHTLFSNNLNTVNGDVLHHASEFGYLQPFWDVLQGRNVTIIGAEYFKELPFRHIVIPNADSFGVNKLIFEQANRMNVPGLHESPVYLVAAAMNSNVIIDKLPKDVTAIDIGSVFDPYLGRPRATYQREKKLKPLW